MDSLKPLSGRSCVTEAEPQLRDASPALTRLVLDTIRAEIQSYLAGISLLTAAAPTATTPIELSSRLDEIRGRSQALLGMIRESRAYPASARSGAARDFSCEGIVSNAVQLLTAPACEFGCDVSYAVDPHVPRKLSCDGDYLREMLICLIRDAIRVRRARRIHLSVQPGHATAAPARLLFRLALDELAGQPLPARVDIGGLAAGAQHSWADLDLPVASEFARLIGAELRSERADGVFLLSVDVPVQAPSAKERSRESSWERSELRILLAEDNLINQRVGKLTLERAGYKVDVVSDGAEALAACGKLPYDIILMDCQMPELDGFEATVAIRARPGPQPVILAVTAYARADEREHCLKAGMDDYLAKPFQAEQLIALVEKGTRLRRRRAPQHAAALIHAQSA